jgi:drug/metabolite transporter (DMT)-like permease
MGAMLFYLRPLQSEEASVVAPFFQAVPLFGYALAYFVLGERLSILQMAGGALIIAGTLIVSVRFDRNARVFKWRLAVLMLACGFAAALSGLIFKVFAIEVEFWVTTFWMFVGEAIFGTALLSIGSYRRQIVAVLRANTAALLTINGSNELINLGGGLGNRYALMFAPLSIVQAIGSTTTLFVFAFGVALSVLFPRLARETLSLRDLVQKGTAALFVAAGVALVTR